MPHSAIEGYMNNLEKNHALMRMMMGEAAKLPHMDDDARREWANDIDEKINGSKRQIRIAPRAVLKILGIGIRR